MTTISVLLVPTRYTDSVQRVAYRSVGRLLRDGTNERTNERSTHVTNKTSCSDTCAHVQKSHLIASRESQPLTRCEGRL